MEFFRRLFGREQLDMLGQLTVAEPMKRAKGSEWMTGPTPAARTELSDAASGRAFANALSITMYKLACSIFTDADALYPAEANDLPTPGAQNLFGFMAYQWTGRYSDLLVSRESETGGLELTARRHQAWELSPAMFPGSDGVEHALHRLWDTPLMPSNMDEFEALHIELSGIFDEMLGVSVSRTSREIAERGQKLHTTKLAFEEVFLRELGGQAAAFNDAVTAQVISDYVAEYELQARSPE